VGGACDTHTYRRNEKSYKILVGKPEGKRQLGRPKRVCEIILEKFIWKLCG
jgi:hypothetical protein